MKTSYTYHGYRPSSCADMAVVDCYTSADGVNSFSGNAVEEAVRLGYKFIENGDNACIVFAAGNTADFVRA